LGVAGPAIIDCALLATKEVCRATGRDIDLVLVDAGRAPADVAGEVDLPVGARLVDGLVGTHTSNIRVAVGARVNNWLPYVFTPSHKSCLVAVGGDTSGELYTVMPTSLLQDDDRHRRLLESYVARFGLTAPLPGSYAKGCYDGVHLLAAVCCSDVLATHTAAQVAERLFSAAITPARSNAVDFTRRPMRLARANDTDLEVVGMLNGV
jgi:hypothetical protein